jgi:hypothetical protein
LLSHWLLRLMSHWLLWLLSHWLLLWLLGLSGLLPLLRLHWLRPRRQLRSRLSRVGREEALCPSHRVVLRLRLPFGKVRRSSERRRIDLRRLFGERCRRCVVDRNARLCLRQPRCPIRFAEQILGEHGTPTRRQRRCDRVVVLRLELWLWLWL